MKNQFIITAVLFCVLSFTSQTIAQISTQRTTGYDVKKNVRCVIVSTENGCVVSFEGVTAPRDAASGLATGKRQHKPVSFVVSPTDNSVSEVINPRDAARGLPTGKRQHKPIVISGGIDKSTPILGRSSVNTANDGMDSAARGTGGGAGKVSLSDFHFVISNKGRSTVLSSNDQDCDISTDLPDGEYMLITSWSWGETQSGTYLNGTSSKASPKMCSVNFYLQIEEGVCMAINQKGTGSNNNNK